MFLALIAFVIELFWRKHSRLETSHCDANLIKTSLQVQLSQNNCATLRFSILSKAQSCIILNRKRLIKRLLQWFGILICNSLASNSKQPEPVALTNHESESQISVTQIKVNRIKISESICKTLTHLLFCKCESSLEFLCLRGEWLCKCSFNLTAVSGVDEGKMNKRIS